MANPAVSVNPPTLEAYIKEVAEDLAEDICVDPRRLCDPAVDTCKACAHDVVHRRKTIGGLGRVRIHIAEKAVV